MICEQSLEGWVSVTQRGSIGVNTDRGHLTQDLISLLASGLTLGVLRHWHERYFWVNVILINNGRMKDNKAGITCQGRDQGVSRNCSK